MNLKSIEIQVKRMNLFFYLFLQEKINVCPNVRTLQKILHEGDEQILQLNIPEYLVYASKRYCNYKAIVAAIEQSCDDVDVKFYSVNSFFSVLSFDFPFA